MQIYVLCPDNDKPSGGIRKLYRHVDVLNKHGFSAWIVHQQKGFKCSWFSNHTRVTYLSDLQIEASDYLVVPEIYGAEIANIGRGIKKVIFNQNCYYTFWGHSWEKDNLVTPYLSEEIVYTIVVSQDSAEYLQYAFPELKIIRIHYGIDQSLFSYNSKKKQQIAFMPRKHADEVTQVLNQIKFRGLLEDFELAAIDNKNEREVAKILQESLIFLSFGYPEGFQLPPAEAMACGCLVIGYHGMGGKEFFHPEFCYPIPQGEIVNFAKAIESAINLYAENPQQIEEKTKKASEYIRENYSVEGEEQDIVACWQTIVTTDKLRDVNLIIFPDWSQAEEVLGLELEGVLKNILSHPDKGSMTLLIDTSDIDEDEANLILADLTMKILMETNLDVTDGPEIYPIGEVMWSSLLPQIHYRILLDRENQRAIAQAGAENISLWEASGLK